MATLKQSVKKDRRKGGIPKYPTPHGSLKTPSKMKKGAAWEKGQSEFANRRKKWKKTSSSQKRGATLYEDYTYSKPPKPKRKSKLGNKAK